LIDLHTHTTASDGRLSPAALAGRAAAAGVTVLAVTDHDTVAACDEAAAACADAGVRFVAGIEITAVCAGADLHVLGYFIDWNSPALLGFLAEQRKQRVERVREMVARLARHGIALDAEQILEPARRDQRRAVGRPWIARALVEAGHVADTDEAFDRWLARGRPAFVARRGPPPADVFARIHDAGGVASLAHPGLAVRSDRDHDIEGFAASGLDAIEAFHSEHDAAATKHYLELADRLGLAVSGGSDFHADPSHGPAEPGAVSLPPEYFEGLIARKRASA
jgi:3',5'-nucleoside bisphosphate phosphatase